MTTINIALKDAYQQAFDVLISNGFSAPHADAIARNVTAGERDGCASHGLWRLLGIVETLRKGKVSPDAEPTVVDQAPAIVKADANGAYSLCAYEKALPLLIEKARQCGIAALAINRCVHFSALFADVEPLTDVGLVGYACTPSHAWVAPAGGTHKGSALAAMVELFAGPLIGDMTSAESLAWDNGAGGLPYGGELILALDPQRFLGGEAEAHLARAETLFSGMQSQGARLPGERRYLAREQSEKQGLEVSRGLYDEICALRG